MIITLKKVRKAIRAGQVVMNMGEVEKALTIPGTVPIDLEKLFVNAENTEQEKN